MADSNRSGEETKRGAEAPALQVCIYLQRDAQTLNSAGMLTGFAVNDECHDYRGSL